MEKFVLEKDFHLQEYLDGWNPFLERLPAGDFRLDLAEFPNTRYLSISYKVIRPNGFELISTYRHRFLIDYNMDPDSVRNRIMVTSHDGIKASGPFIDTKSQHGLIIPVSRKDGLKGIGKFLDENLEIIDGSVTHALYTLVQGYHILQQLHQLD